MRIERIEVWTVKIPLDEPYTIAYTHTDHADNVFLRIHTNTQHVGLGSANPDPEVTGETPAMVESGLKDAFGPQLIGADPLQRARVLERARAALPDAPATLAALDMALFDLLGKFADMPLFQLLGGDRTSIRTATTIGIESEEATIAHARDWVARGFTLLKIKGGLDVDADIARVRKVRERVGNGVDLCFDANQGYSLDQALRFASATATTGLLFVEQPSPKADLELLGKIRRGISIPVMADECMCSARDAYNIAHQNLASWINLKLMKIGGIAPALRVVAVAESSGLDVMVGCMDESELSIAAGLHVALASPHIDLVDLDGHFALVGDPAAGAIGLENGCLKVPRRPGLGIVLS